MDDLAVCHIQGIELVPLKETINIFLFPVIPVEQASAHYHQFSLIGQTPCTQVTFIRILVIIGTGRVAFFHITHQRTPRFEIILTFPVRIVQILRLIYCICNIFCNLKPFLIDRIILGGLVMCRKFINGS